LQLRIAEILFQLGVVEFEDDRIAIDLGAGQDEDLLNRAAGLGRDPAQVLRYEGVRSTDGAAGSIEKMKNPRTARTTKAVLPIRICRRCFFFFKSLLTISIETESSYEQTWRMDSVEQWQCQDGQLVCK
jgi:hypothetical protein